MLPRFDKGEQKGAHDDSPSKNKKKIGALARKRQSQRKTILVSRTKWEIWTHGISEKWDMLQYSDLFVETRKFFRGKIFGIISMVSLIGALYLPDMFILVNSTTGEAGDGILTIIMIIFALEWLLLSITDRNYVFGAFWWMDTLGTLSMAFDISYMLGTKSSHPTILKTDADAAESAAYLVYLRTGRMAKLGARAGRVSRILKILRFLPFLQVQDQDSTMMAHKISSQLSNVLGTRIAILTLVMAILMPIPGIFMFPTYDYSLKYVPLHVSQILEELYKTIKIQPDGTIRIDKELQPAVTEEFNFIATFYDLNIGYGPYDIFIGRCYESINELPPYCEQWRHTTNTIIPIWHSHMYYYEPSRPANINYAHMQFPLDLQSPGILLAQKDNRHVHEAELIVAWNMTWPITNESQWNLGIITFVMIVMIGSGLILSNSVSDLALRPMERMLRMVREIAQTMFSNLPDDESDDEFTDVDQSSEMQLLEKILKRLATIAEITTKKAVDVGMNREEMKEEDVGILNLMCGGNNDEIEKVDEHKHEMKQEVEGEREEEGKQLLSMGIDQEIFNSWNFLTTDVGEPEHLASLCGWILYNHSSCSDFSHKYIDKVILAATMKAAGDAYIENPYHNFSHALDICHTEHQMLLQCHSYLYINELEHFALLLSAVFHDVAHPGLNNPFLIDTAHELAIRYNDRSPLENMHCSKLFYILTEDKTELLKPFSTEQYKEIRKICVEVILHTDVVQHFAMVKELSVFYQMNQEYFDFIDIGYPPGDEEVTVFRQPDTKKLLMNMFLHTADVSNPCKPWKVCFEWAQRVLEEFFIQGDQERELGIPIQMLNDRTKVNKPNSQIGFIEFIVTPLIVAIIKILPYSYNFGDNIENNLSQWSRVWVIESNPSEDEIRGVEGRLEKVSLSIRESKSRILITAEEDDLDAVADESLKRKSIIPGPRS